MIVRRHGEKYNFYGDTETGITMRWGSSVNVNPEYAPWPELADISISNHCTKGCEFCYKGSENNNSFMSTEEYEYVLSALQSEKWGNVFQVALGGGEPLEHPDFIDIINVTNEKGIVANFTTNGIHLNEEIANEIKGKVGAVAISVNRIEELNMKKVKVLTDSEIKTNIHFVLDNTSIYEAINILKGKYNELLDKINGIIFLTYKPAGRATIDKCLSMDDEKLMEFISLVENNECITRIGFDACFVPLLMKYTGVNADYIDSCECGFFSVYIDEKMNVKPCSFANNDRFTFNLKEYDMKDIWENKYGILRKEMLSNSCINECINKNNCRGKCGYFDTLSFCYNLENK
ncbi:radical SAM protein [Clostridium sp. BL-8]|uniref:radical SAM protein n=1 Tax=Clostridium sp. BL-8 TaxID=349938 RepID=UPI00098CDEFA|nr:radical SAM protein [Clostridium sp. BL-8]OOM79524.1 cyclic pyranopterin monophosphate synthase [Clostridium sp. BL-8]